MSCFCGLMESEPATGSYDRAQMDAQKMATQHNSRANHSDGTPSSRKHDEKVALSNDGKLVISTAPVEGKDKTVLNETWVEMKALDKRIAQNWLRYTGPADYTTIIEILVDRAKLLELVNKYGNDGGNLRDPAMEKLLQRADVTNTKLAAVTETLEAEIDGLQRRELELKKMWALVKQSDDNQGVDLMRNELGELIIEVKMYKSRWENALDTRLKQKLRQVEIAVEIINEETKGANEDGTFPSSGVMLKQVSSPSFRATRRSITRVLSLRTDEDQEDPNSSFRLASKRINTLELLAGMVEPGGTERFQSAVLADQGRKSSQPGLAPAASFSAQLYQTVNRRDGEVQDVGKELVVSRVRGDGRCLFRSVARGQHYLVNAAGLRDWNENKERSEADRLRGKVVAELRKHRELLISFCVVDGEFNRYCQIMSDPKTFGGEPELLMLALIVHTPISVYLSNRSGYSQIQVYGRQYTTDPINILYKDGIHYDALLSKKGRGR